MTNEELKALAKRATPGEWSSGQHPEYPHEALVTAPNPPPGHTPWHIAHVFDGAGGGPSLDNAAYIAAANSTRILALLDEIERKDAALREIKIRSTPGKFCTYAVTANDLHHCHTLANAALALGEHAP